MSLRLNPCLNKSFQQNESIDNGSSLKPSALSNRSFQIDPNQGIYDYNPNIKYKTRNPETSSKLNTWNIADNISESVKTTKDEKATSSQNSNRSRDVVTALKENQIRSVTEERLPSNRQRDYGALREIALYKQKQALADQEKYRRELETQMQEKRKRQHDEKVHDMRFNNSGLMIGEVNQGLDVDQYAKNLKIRQNQEDIKKALNRSFTNQERSVSVQNIRGLSDQSNLNSSYIQNPRLIDEREEDELGQVEKYTPEYHQRKIQIQAQKGDQTTQKHNVRGYPQYNENTPDPRLQLQKVHHDKLKKSIQNQLKKNEEYTAKLYNDQQNRKKELGEALSAQIVNNQFKQRAALYKEKEQEPQNKSYDGIRPSPGQPIDRAWETRNVLVSTIEKKYKAQLEAKQNREKLGDGPRILDREGRYKRLIDDTVKRIITRYENGTNRSNREVKAFNGRR